MRINSLAANQTEIIKSNGDLVFVSYSTPVAAILEGVSYKTTRKFSSTTTRHINNWLGNGGVNAIEKPQEFFESLI